MNNTKQKHGFILVLVVTMIPLIGMVIAILTANSKTLTIKTRQAILQVKANDACQSGIAWAQVNPAEIRSLVPEKPLSLIIEDGSEQICCRIECILSKTDEPVIRFTGLAENRRYSAHHAQEVASQTF